MDYKMRRKPKTDFGVEIKVFQAQTGMTIKEIADEAGVKYTTLVETTTGRCAGHELIPKVREYIAQYHQRLADEGERLEAKGA